MKFSKSLLLNGGLIIGSVLVCFLIAEVVARMVLPKQRVKRSPQVRHLYSEALGWAIEPKQSAYTFSFPVTMNSEGWRYREFAQPKPAGVIRILCLGDSLTFGAGVRDEDTYPAQLETLLNQGNPPHRPEVLNMGVFGYGTRQEIDVLQTKGVHYQPDLVILGFYANDPEDTRRYYRFHQTLANDVTPPLFPPQAGGGRSSDPVPMAKTPAPTPTVAEPPARQSWLRQFVGTHLAGKRLLPPSVMYLLQNSRVAYYCGWLINRLVIRESMEADLLQGKDLPEIRAAWQQVDECFKEAAALGREYHFKLVILIFPHPQQLAQDYPAAEYQSKVQELAAKYDIPSVDLLPAFKGAYTTFESLFIPYDGHPNETAYQITAAAMHAFLNGKDGFLRTTGITSQKNESP